MTDEKTPEEQPEDQTPEGQQPEHGLFQGPLGLEGEVFVGRLDRRRAQPGL